MLRPRLSRPNGKIKAQALVEFTLTAMLLLLMLTMIIEVARIFQAYVTLQGAARAGARYAITGQWDGNYAGDPTTVAGVNQLKNGWDMTTPGIPLKHIPPCWPRFSPYAPFNDNPYYPYTINNLDYNEPYRDPRTCSIEATVIRSLTGLQLDPYNTPSGLPPTTQTTGGQLFTPSGLAPLRVCCYMSNLPFTYTIRVLGFSNDKYPASGQFGHPDPEAPGTWDPDAEYSDTPVGSSTSQVAGYSSGYGGDPGQKVTVLVDYRLGMITPILSRIVPSIPLHGIATMTNEAFGSTGVQSNAVLPPPLPELPQIEELIPADLIVQTTDFSVLGVPPNPSPNSDVQFNVAAFNQGQQGTLNEVVLRLYGVKTTPITPVNPTSLSNAGPTYLGETTIDALLSENTKSATKTVTVQFPSGGIWHVYAFVDATTVEDEEGVSLPNPDPAREANNVTGPITLNVTSEADLKLTKTVSNLTPASGSTVDYTLTLQNLGGANATNIDVTDALPTGLTFLSSTPNTYSGSTWHINTLNNQATTSVKITARVTAATGTTIVNKVTNITIGSGTVFDPDHSNDYSCTNKCNEATIVVGAINLQITKSTLGVPAKGVIEGASNTFQYRMVVKNNGSTATANNVRITDTLPTGISYVAGSAVFSPAGGSCNASSPFTCTIATLAPGASVTLTMTVYANAGTGGQTITNTAAVVANEADPDTTDNTSSVSVTVQSVDIEITKVAVPLFVAENNPFTWTVTAKNIGTNDAGNVTITDNVPTGSLNTTITYTPSSGTSYSTTTKIWTIGNLNAGQSKTLTITASPKTGTVNTTINNTATLTTVDKTDVNPANNSATSPVGVTNVNAADLQMAKSVSPTAAGPNTDVTYTLSVTNNGPRTANSVVVTDASLLNKITTGFFTYAGSPPAAWNQTTGQWNVGTLTAGSTATLQITVELIGNSTTTTFTNTATVTSSTSDQTPGNNSASATLTINWPATIFANAGGAGCPTDLWGLQDTVNFNFDRSWLATQPYVAGSWGVYGSNYVRNGAPLAPPTGPNFVMADGTTNVAAPGQNLLGCTTTGTNFYYKFDGLLPGTYEVSLLFADPGNVPGKHRFSVDLSTYKGKTAKVLKNFDINKAITDSGLTYKVGANNYRYIVKRFTYKVKSGKGTYLRVHFTYGKKTSLYTNNVAMISGVGIAYKP